MDEKIIAERIRYYRKIRGWSQEQLAEKMMTTQCVISCTENAKIGSWIDSLSKLGIIADALEIDLQTLIFGSAMCMKNYKKVPMQKIEAESEIYVFNDLVVTANTDYFITEGEESFVNTFSITASIKGTIVGKINGLYTSAYNMFKNPRDIFCILDGESAIYADEVQAYLERVYPQEAIGVGDLEICGLSDEEIDVIYEKMDSKKKIVVDKVTGDDYYNGCYVVFYDDILVNPDCRQHGIFTKMMEVCDYMFGDDYSGAAYIYPVKTDDYGDVVDDDDNAEADLQRNRTIAEKYGWFPTDDYHPTATYVNTYALRLPEHILDIANIGEKLRKYIPDVDWKL